MFLFRICRCFSRTYYCYFVPSGSHVGADEVSNLKLNVFIESLDVHRDNFSPFLSVFLCACVHAGERGLHKLKGAGKRLMTQKEFFLSLTAFPGKVPFTHTRCIVVRSNGEVCCKKLTFSLALNAGCHCVKVAPLC